MTSKESIIAYRDDAAGDGDGGQAAAAIESIITYRGDAVGDGDGGQATAVIESIIAYRCNAIGNSDRSKAATAFKCTNMDVYVIIKCRNGVCSTVIADG